MTRQTDNLSVEIQLKCQRPTWIMMALLWSRKFICKSLFSLYLISTNAALESFFLKPLLLQQTYNIRIANKPPVSHSGASCRGFRGCGAQTLDCVTVPRTPEHVVTHVGGVGSIDEWANRRQFHHRDHCIQLELLKQKSDKKTWRRPHINRLSHSLTQHHFLVFKLLSVLRVTFPNLQTIVTVHTYILS